MKKHISLLLITTLFIMTIYPCLNAISTYMERKSVLLFSNRIVELNEKYESNPDSFEAKYNENNPNAVENRLIIKTRDNISDDTALESISGLEYTVFQYENKKDMEQAYDELSKKGYTVQKDSYLHTYATNLDDAKWGMETLGTDYTKSEIMNTVSYKNEIVIGVLDSGINYEHELFADRITDTTFNMSASGVENDCMDDNGHGTAVAGVIALNTPNNVKIKPYKIMDKKGVCTLSTFISAIEVILADNNKPDIINLSLGAYDPFGEMDIQTELIAELIESGVTVCVAAGNDNLPIEYIAPGDCESAITVGAYDSNYHICSFSNYGNEVDVAAPGKNIYTASRKSADAYSTFSGTSAACPFVSSACAYILMQNPKLSPVEVQNTIKASAIDMGEDDEMYFGSGMLNMVNLIDNKTENIPVPSVTGGLYHNTQTVTFEDVPADTQLVYTLDKSIPSSNNGAVYSTPITIDNEMQLNYALIKEGKYTSNISSQYYTVQYIANENDFEITEEGVITAYNGNKNNIIVPDTINGITPINIGKNAFRECNLTSIMLPNTVENIDTYGFYKSKELKHFTGNNVTLIGYYAFEGCSSLRDECMPVIYSLGEAAFKDCTMLHNIDFENCVEYLDFNVFQNSGLTNVSFPNVVECDIEYLFYKSTIMTCDISNNELLSSFSFSECNYLYELKTQSAIEIGYNVIVNTYYLDELDLSSAVYIAESAFNKSYIDTLYAPECELIFDYDMACGIGEGSYIRVIDFPKLTRITSRHLFDDMFVEEIYLESIEDLPDDAFINLPALKVLYLPKAKTFNYIDVDKYGEYPYSAPLEIAWIPQVAKFTRAFYFSDATKLVYAPSITKIQMENYNTTFVLSEKATTVNIRITSEGWANQIFPTIIAPKNSAAWNQWKYSDEDPITYIDSDSIVKSLGAQIRTRDNGLRFGFMLDESALGFDISEYENLYKRINKEYGFAYSFDGLDENSETVSMDLRAGNENTLLKEATKRNVDGTISTYNAVFTGIPESHYDDRISARAYVCIDGMYFYSPIETCSINSTTAFYESDINDNEIQFEHEHNYKFAYYSYGFYYMCSDCNNIVAMQKDELPNFIDYINQKVVEGSDAMYLDVVPDGIINAKDFAKIRHLSKYGW